MHICHIITRLIIGGAQENTVLTCRGLVDKGHEVTLIAGPETGPEGSLWDQARESGCNLIQVPALHRAVRPLGEVLAYCKLVHLLRRLDPDVVHTHSSKAGILGRAAASRADVGVIVHTIHGMSFNRTQTPAVRMLYRWVERRAAKRCHKIVTVADAMIDQAVAAELAPRGKFTKIYSGMETNRFEPDAFARGRARRAWGIEDDDIVVGTIARLFHNKGYEEIIEAMPAAIAKEPKLRFVWIGDGAHRTQYEQRLDAIGLRRRVHFLGLIDPDQVGPQINGFDILLHASKWEGLPRAVVQGLICEVPAITFDNDGAPEVVTTDETGICVPLGDTDAMSTAIVKLARDRDLRARLGQTGRVRCMAMFNWKRMVDELDELYQQLAEDV